MLLMVGPLGRALGNLLGRLRCRFGRHRPVRKAVRWNGLHYRAECRHCGAVIQRLPLGGWRASEGIDPRLTGTPTGSPVAD